MSEHAKASGKSISLKYESIPMSVRYGYGTADEKKQARETISAFINNAKIGDIYELGGIGREQAEIVSDRKSPNGMGIKSVGSNRRPVQLSRANAEKYIANGAELKERKTTADITESTNPGGIKMTPKKNSMEQYLYNGKWGAKAINDRLDKIETGINNIKSPTQVSKYSKALKEQDKVITTALSKINEKYESKEALLSARRRTRALIKKAENKR